MKYVRRMLLLLVMFISQAAISAENYILRTPVSALKDLLDCSDQAGATSTLCLYLSTQVGQALANSNVTIGDNEVIVHASPLVTGRDRYIDTGHSCSWTARVSSSHASLSLKDSTSVSLMGDLISSPLMMAGNIDVGVYTQARIKEEFGFRYHTIHCSGLKCKKVTKCAVYATDSWSVAAEDDFARGSVLVGVNLQPKYGETGDGGYYVSVTPLVYVAMSVKGLDPEVTITGKNNLLGAFAYLPAALSTASELQFDWMSFKFQEAAFESAIAGSNDPIKQTYYQLEERGQTFLGELALSGASLLELNTTDQARYLEIFGVTNSDNQGYELWEYIADYFIKKEVKDSAKDTINDEARDLEDKIYKELDRALGLDSNGSRVWIINQEDLQRIDPGWTLPMLMEALSLYF